MEYILRNYIEVSENEPLAQNPLAFLIRTELPNDFSNEIPNSRKYHIKGSPGIGSWAAIPWIGFLNDNISPTFKEGYYVAYLFKEDMSGFYLSLMFGVGNFRNVDVDILSNVSNDLRKIIQIDFPQISAYSPMKLRKQNSNSYMAQRYENATIYSIEYQTNDLPSEKELINDLTLLLKIYDIIYENNSIDLLIHNHTKLNNKSENMPIHSQFNDSNIFEVNVKSKGFDKVKFDQNLNISIFNPNTFYRPVLELFHDGKDHYTEEIVEEIRKILPDDEKYSKRVTDWVMSSIMHLRNAGCLKIIDRGLHRITVDGLRLLEKDIVSLDLKVLKEHCPKYREKFFKSEPIQNPIKRDNQKSNINISNSNTFYRPVLELFHDGKNHHSLEIAEEIREILPDDEKDSDRVTPWVLSTIKHFRTAGCLKRIGPELHCITGDGMRLLEKDIVRLDRKVLKKYCPKYQEKYFKSESASNSFNDNQKSNITISDSNTFYRPVLELFRDGKAHRSSEIVGEIRKILPDDEKDSDKVETWVQYPIKHFRDAGCLERINRGLHCITGDGMKLLEKDIYSLDRKVLKEYCPKYREKYVADKKIDSENLLGSNQDNFRNKHTVENEGFDKKLVISDPIDNKINIHEIESKPNKYYNFKKHSNKFKKLSKLLSDKNIEKLDNLYYLEENEFDEIIEHVINTHNKVLKKLIDENAIDFEKLNILEKMFLFSKSFVKTHYKRSGDDLGYYRFNEIYVDEREPTDYKKIRTIIHELSHFLLSEILEQILSEILDTDKTDILESFVFYTLTDINDFYLIDEYCACTVEGRFVSLGHQDYTSFKNSLNKEHTYSDEDISKIGNTFAKYIMLIMDSFINESLINEIRKEGSEIDYHHNDITFETEEYLEWDDFKDTMRLILGHKTNFTTADTETIIEYSIKINKNNR